MAENPPLNRLYVLGYAANDRDYPTVSMNLDPRVAGYKVPEDLSTCPDKRYPNHVFTGAQPLSGDERVRHVWEILPSPWVPFTRYDDDLGPIQGRRRSVENTGQQASLASDTKISYEGREGSAIVSTELEETWSIKTDEDGNSLFPIKDRDFYDASRGPVQERRQLFVPTGEEVGSLENVNGVITQTSYEPYNEFLSVKIIQTYSVDGPALVGKATDNDGQLVTVTTQRKGALNYVPPNPTATRTVEVNREDAEALIERIVDTPEIFKANTFSVERPDPIPQKFRVAVPIQSSQEIVEGDAEVPTLEEGEISKSQEQRNKFIKRVSSTSRDQAVLPKTLIGRATNNERQEVTVTETLQLGNTTESPTATTTIESEALGDGNYVVTKTQVAEVFGAETYRKTKDDLTPQKFKAKQEESTVEENVAGIASSNITLTTGQFVKSEQQINKFVKRVSTTTRNTQKSEELNEKVITPEGQLASRTITLANGIQTLAPSATVVDGNIEELGDGRTVKTEIKIDKVFDAKTQTLQQPFQLPAKFITGETKEESIVEAATLATPEALGKDGTGIVESTAQRVTEFTVKKTKRTIDGETSTTEKQINDSGQEVTIESTVSDGSDIETGALIEIARTQALGGGKFLKEIGKIEKVFDSKQKTITQATQIPSKFLNEETTEESFVEEGDAEEPEELGDDGFGVVQSSSQRIGEFTRRQTKRGQSGVTELTEEQTNSVNQKVKVTSTITDDDSIDVNAKTEFARTQAIGGGKFLKEVGTVDEIFDGKTITVAKDDNIPLKFRAKLETTTEQTILEGNDVEDFSLENEELQVVKQRVSDLLIKETKTSRPEDYENIDNNSLEDSWGIQIPYTESIEDNVSQEPNSESEGLGDGRFLVRKYNPDDVASIASFSTTYPTTINLNIPRELKSIKVKWQKEHSIDETTSETGVPQGDLGSSTVQTDAGSIGSTITIVPRFDVSIVERSGNSLPAEVKIFFLKKENLGNILSRSGAGGFWPSFNPQTFSTTIFGKSETKLYDVEVTRQIRTPFGYIPSVRQTVKYQINLIPVELNIPSCLTIARNIGLTESYTQPQKVITLTYASFTTGDGITVPALNVFETVNHSLDYDEEIEIPATNYTTVPTSGKYLVDANIEAFKFGWFLVRAVVFDASDIEAAEIDSEID
jgi:hypothetical protein